MPGTPLTGSTNHNGTAGNTTAPDPIGVTAPDGAKKQITYVFNKAIIDGNPVIPTPKASKFFYETASGQVCTGDNTPANAPTVTNSPTGFTVTITFARQAAGGGQAIARALWSAGWMAAAVGAVLLVLLVLAMFNRILLKMALRNIPRRRAQTVLILFGLMLATLITTASLAVGDTLTYSLVAIQMPQLGGIDDDGLAAHIAHPAQRLLRHPQLRRSASPEEIARGGRDYQKVRTKRRDLLANGFEG